VEPFNNESNPPPAQLVSIRVLGVDAALIYGTLLQITGQELQVRLRDSPAPRHLSLDAALRIDGPDTTVLGELAANCSEQGETVLTITVRHVLTELSELSRMRRALVREAGPTVDMGSTNGTPRVGGRMKRT
jgi:hypothetical protein